MAWGSQRHWLAFPCLVNVMAGFSRVCRSCFWAIGKVRGTGEYPFSTALWQSDL